MHQSLLWRIVYCSLQIRMTAWICYFCSGKCKWKSSLRHQHVQSVIRWQTNWEESKRIGRWGPLLRHIQIKDGILATLKLSDGKLARWPTMPSVTVTNRTAKIQSLCHVNSSNLLRYWQTAAYFASQVSFFVIMTALWNTACHYIFALSFVLSFFFFSWPNLSRRRLDVCHTCTHGVALVRI